MASPSLYEFQKVAIADLLGDKHLAIMGCGTGKTAVALNWMAKKVKETGIKKVCFWTPA